MAVRRKSARNRRRKKGRRIPVPVLVAIAIAIMIGAVFSVVSLIGPSQKPLQKRDGTERLKMPQRPVEQPAVVEDYSAAVPPPPEAALPQKRSKARHGSVAIIVDDMGNSTHEADTLLAIGVPITFSIIPGLGRVREVAEAAHGRGGEVMVHIPMEPKGYQQKPFEKNGLLLSQSDEEIEKRVEAFVGSIPYAVGANNHMGSRFTEDRAKMSVVLTLLKKKGLFFIDSKTSPLSVGGRVAREVGVSVASRNVFLDNEQNVEAIEVQLHKVAEMASKSGSAIAICHPHKTTIQALASALPTMRKEGISFVHASDLVR